MTREKAEATGAVPEDVHREPDRAGSILGLSRSGFHEVAYVEWGPADTDDVVICVHGLTRQGRDFDYLARELAARGRRVVCPDLVGRGRSGWLRDPADYTVLQYCADMNALIARTGAGRVDWVGTSLGGLIGIVLAGLPDSPIRRLVVNDIGPVVRRAFQDAATAPSGPGSASRLNQRPPRAARRRSGPAATPGWSPGPPRASGR